MELKSKKVTVIGLGKSGRAAADLVLNLGGQARISESGRKDSLDQETNAWLAQHHLESEFGGHRESFIQKSDLLVISPGIRPDALPIQWAKKKKIPVLGEIELAYLFCPAPIIAVTGSNGKTTVATLINEILNRSEKSACLCGNIGKPFSGEVLRLTKKDTVVLEVSSFQLESIIDFKPHVAVFLNFSQNHLDRHKDIDEYFEAKKRIFLNQDEHDYAVLNKQDTRVNALASELKAQVCYFDPSGYRHKGINPDHLAAIAVGKLFKIEPQFSQIICLEFTGIEHRLEWVRSLQGIDFINDAKATTAEASRWAIEHIQQPIVMICGGRDKNIDFSSLKSLVKQRVKEMFVIGEAKEKLKKTFGDVIPVRECSVLESAVQKARESARKGDCIVFSPMCTSFDMFKNFEERGQVFKKIVKELT